MIAATAILVTGCVTTAEKADFSGMEKVTDVSMPQKAIFEKAKLFAATKFASPKKAIEYQDAASGVLIFTGYTTWDVPMSGGAQYQLHFKVTVSAKDNRYKTQLEPTHAIDHYERTTPILKNHIENYRNVFNSINKELAAFMVTKSDW